VLCVDSFGATGRRMPFAIGSSTAASEVRVVTERSDLDVGRVGFNLLAASGIGYCWSLQAV